MAQESVSSTSELIDAIDRLGSGDTIDATNAPGGNTVPSGTLDGQGVTVTIDTHKSDFLRVENSNTTLKNITLEGHVYDEVAQNGHWDYPDSAGAYDQDAVGVEVITSNATINGITARGWTFAGIKVGEGGGSTQVTPTITNCSLVDNNCRGLGYGVVVYSGYPTIEWCYFNNNRHDISGSGESGCGYEARNNHVGPTGRIYGFEMHEPGGESVHVHHNTFEDKFKTMSPNTRCELIVNRGTPSQSSTVENNWFKAPSSAESDIFQV